MSLVGFKARNHRQQTDARGALDAVDDRRTPDTLYLPLEAEFGFTLDVAASAANAKCGRYFTLEDDGLAQSWADERVWCNPPYSDCGTWVAKAHREAVPAVLLLPANRTEQRWWQEMVEPWRDSGAGLTTRFLKGRPRFDVPAGTYADPRGNRPPFGLVLLVFHAAL